MILRAAILILSVSLLALPLANAAETDQFIALDADLADAGDAINEYLNEQAEIFLEQENSRCFEAKTKEKLVRRYYFHLFKGLHASRFRHWLFTTDAIERYPDNEVSYPDHLGMSVYDAHVFPFFLPMARTIRVGDVHFGIDKMGHFFGFGRRSFRRYNKYRDNGLNEEEALNKVVRHEFWMERVLVGNLVDGILSYADLEANFQGMTMARALAESEDPFFERLDGQWVQRRPIDIRPYITPNFDESYNCSRYFGRRKKQVFENLRELHCDKFDLPEVKERFERYDTYPRSFCQQYIDRYYEERGRDPRIIQAMDRVCVEN